MKIINKKKFTLLLTLALLVMTAVPAMAAGQPTVNLGTTSSYAVFAGSTITNTGTTTINGDAGADIGLYPGTVLTGQADIAITNGTIHLADAAAIEAKDDLITAYDDAAGRTPVTRIPTELGGTTLTPGVYDSADGTFQITGTLTLDGNGELNPVFVFKTASTLITASDSNVNLINGARYCRTFWQVGSSATLGTNSHFVGHIFAFTSITVNTGATVQGQLLARTGAVTLDNNTITNGICTTTTTPTPETASLHVIKHVINDNGSTAAANDFNLHVKSLGIDVAGSPATGAESPGTTYTLAAGTYQVSEDVFANYTLSYSGDSDSDGNIILAPGDNKTVTITNNDISLVPSENNNEQDTDDNTTPEVDIEQEVDITPEVDIEQEVDITSEIEIAPEAAPTEVVNTTVTGGELPNTATPWSTILFAGVALMIIGAVSLSISRKYE